ncbi:MAG: dienelactone hydrolase family protein [Woeseiaceae bacterium]|nr:dienelactone hydrolase family protein [Woeseiaceae bacterium]
MRATNVVALGSALLLFAASGCSRNESPVGDAGEPASRTAPAADATASGEPAAPARDVTAESLPYGEIANELVYGHFAIPTDMIDPYPAIILVHDWWGLTDEVRGRAERLAAEGYIVLAVDLFSGKTADTVTGARELEIEAIENPARAEQNLRQAIDFIRASSGAPRIAMLGYGLGGGLALNASLDMDDRLDAVVSFYGPVQTDEEALRSASVPFLGFYLEEDRAVRIENVRTFNDILSAVNDEVDVRIYAEGRRGFADRSSANFDPSLASESWQHMLAFLDSTLSTAAR